jgi:aminoglycoside 3-N-acetyltransferase
MTVRLRDMLTGLRDLDLGEAPVIVHASLSAFGEVEDGTETVVQALTSVFPVVLAPAFTYKTMIIPEVGPENNGITYGSGTDLNKMAEFYSASMRVDPLIGIIPESLRRDARARRSMHPIQSFVGINADSLLTAQAIDAPLAPLGALEKAGGWVLLMGVNHTVNTSIHYAERLAGRRGFVRWALTPKGVVECPHFPGCSAGFETIAPEMDKYARKVQIGKALVQAVPTTMLFRVVMMHIKQDRLALLCQAEDCERCNQIRKSG